MDVTSTFKTEVFRPIAILIVPGAIASFPYFMIATKSFSDLADYRNAHEVPYYAISFLVVLGVGLLLEDLGSLIEAELWDKLLEKKYDLENVWNKYLGLVLEKEPVGQRYIRTMVLRLKFELGTSIAFIPFLIGMAWLNISFPLMSWCGFSWLAGVTAVLFCYLLWESYRGARVLAETRRIILGLEPSEK